MKNIAECCKGRDPGSKLAVDFEVKKKGMSLGTQSVICDHFDGYLFHKPSVFP